MAGLIRLDITVPEESLDMATGILVRHVHHGWEELSLPTGETCLRLHTDSPGLAETVCQACAVLTPGAAIRRQEMDNKDWSEAWRAFFTPVPAGAFVVLPPWLAHTAAADHPNLRPIVIEPKSAFGTGHHATTAVCLKALSEVLPRLGRDKRVLDLGTGSGVLGIACALHGHEVTAADIDPVAVDNALENSVLNHVADRMRIMPGSVEAVAGQRFDLIVANILAGPLREQAPDIRNLLAPDGCLILSGLLDIQADSVAACYGPLGEPRRLAEGEWVGLVWNGSR